MLAAEVVRVSDSEGVMGTSSGSARPEISRTAAAGYRARRDALRAAETGLQHQLDVLATDPDGRRLQAALQEVHATLQEHVHGADAPDGPLAQIVEEAPWLAARVARVRVEHADLLDRATDLLDRVQEGAEVRAGLAEARRLAHAVTRHRHHAADLLLDAYMSDIPAGD